MLRPETVNGLWESPDPIVQGGISKQGVKLSKLPMKSLGFRVPTCTFTEKMVEFEKKVLIEKLRIYR